MDIGLGLGSGGVPGGMRRGQGKGVDAGLRLDLRLVGSRPEPGEGMAEGLPASDGHLPAEIGNLPAEMMGLAPAHAGGGISSEPVDISPGGDDWFAAYTPSGAAEVSKEAGSGTLILTRILTRTRTPTLAPTPRLHS